jgi:hypothetical protein
MTLPFTILNSSGPYREPREPVFSYDFSIQRSTWPTPHGVRIKVSIPDELEHAKGKVLNLAAGTAGQTLIINQMLSRRIAERKLEIATEEGMLDARADVLVPPFTGPFQHLFPKLDAWLNEHRDTLCEDVQRRVGVVKPGTKPG